MNKEDIVTLANLARITLTDEEVLRLEGELSSIVSYIDVITEITSDEDGGVPTIGPLYNVFRVDVVTTEPGSYTEVLLAEMPQREGRYLKVKKILGGTD